MNMGSGTSARIAAQRDPLSLRHRLTVLDQYFAQMTVSGLPAVRVVDVDRIPVAACPACVHDSA